MVSHPIERQSAALRMPISGVLPIMQLKTHADVHVKVCLAQAGNALPIVQTIGVSTK